MGSGGPQVLGSLWRIWSNDRFTEPPPHYNPSSLLREMEKAEIGTKATRAEIIQTLSDRGYVEGEHMTVTHLGFEVANILENYCPAVVSTPLTRELEKRMAKILENKEKRENVVTEVVGVLEPILETLKHKELELGQQLGTVIRGARLDERTGGACRVW